MKIKLLIATGDNDYAEFISNILSEKYADTFDTGVCSSGERLRDLLSAGRFDIVVLESSFVNSTNLRSVQLPLILADESEFSSPSDGEIKKIRKYQRISSIVGNILENYAEENKGLGTFGANKANVTVVWSPSGGSGKTTVALACAAHRISNGKQAIYLNLESFSSTSVYFQENGKSISKVFEKLDSNVNMLLTAIRQQDSGSGISYFCGPDNYDDINVLSEGDIEILINACTVGTDELIVDLSSQYDNRIRKIFDLADAILLVCDPSSTSKAKLQQFVNQHNIFGQIQSKTILVNNKNAKTTETKIGKTVQLPLVQSTDPISIFKTLSSGKFDW